MLKIDQAGAGPGQVIKWNGTAWQPDIDANFPDNDWIRSGGKVYTNNLTDSVGIGTTTPRYALDVNGVICGGLDDTVKALYGGVLSGYNNLAGDAVDDTASAIAGGYNNTINNSYSFIGGGKDNTVSNMWAVVTGGEGNLASSYYSVVGGGRFSQATGDFASVVGGLGNYATNIYSTIGGGTSNRATGVAAAIAGGCFNTASGQYSFVGNGGITNTSPSGNTAAGSYSVAVNGYRNGALADYAFIGTGEIDTIKAIYGAIVSGYSNIAGDTVLDTCAVVCGGYNNSTLAKYAFVGGGLNNSAGSNYSLVVGGDSNTATQQICATLVGGYHNCNHGLYGFLGSGQLNYAAGADVVVCGGNGDSALVASSFIGGGDHNRTTATPGFGYWNATIGGGENNTTRGDNASILGGSGNYAGCFGLGAFYMTIGGGYCDTAKAFASGVFTGYSNIAGDTVLDTCAVVAGGYNNSALAKYSCVPGGRDNSAEGSYAFAAGRRAKAYNQGCFVWGDATDADVSANVDNRWVARCSGGVYFYTNAAMTTGVYVAAGGGSWASVSDRDLKENFKPVDGAEVLNKLAAMPIQTWNYKSQDRTIRHIGPVAQDFAGFGVGEDDKHITTIDADGIAFAAIQELNKKLEKLEAENRELRQRIETLESK